MNLLTKLSIILIMLMNLGCENPFNPSSNNPDNPSDFKPNTTVDILLRNLEDAYTQKNLDLYKYCLADDFIFQLIASEASEIGIDLDNDGVNDEYWGFQQEIKYHEHLFESGSSDGQYPPPDQISLSFQGSTTENDSEEGHEGWIIVSTYFNLNLTFNYNNSSISALGYARFYLKVVDEELKIAIWRDESNIY